MKLLTIVTKAINSTVQPIFRCQSCIKLGCDMVLEIKIMKSCTWHGFSWF